MKDYQRLVRKFNDILDMYDPINLQAPPQEYDMEARILASKIQGCKNTYEVQDLVYATFVEYFDQSTAGDKQKYRSIAGAMFKEITG